MITVTAVMSAHHDRAKHTKEREKHPEELRTLLRLTIDRQALGPSSGANSTERNGVSHFTSCRQTKLK